MSFQDIKEAAIALSADERAELARWLAEAAEKESVAEGDRLQWLKSWRELVSATHAAVGKITWKRDDLYER